MKRFHEVFHKVHNMYPESWGCHMYYVVSFLNILKSLTLTVEDFPDSSTDIVHVGGKFMWKH